MLPLEATSRASTSSLFESPSPTSDPSKYIAQLPAVVLPSVVGVNARMSSSAAPETPITDGSPVVEMSTRLSGRTSIASMSSKLVLRPTSAPLKYMLNVPDVVAPNEVASNRTISEVAYVTLPNVTEVLNDNRSESGSNK